MVKVKEGDTFYFKATVARVNKGEHSTSITFRLPTYGTPITIHESTLDYSLDRGRERDQGRWAATVIRP